VKIAQIAPLIESVPPRLYGGTERIVSYLTEELVQMGHDVTLFASGDSLTSANLVPCAPMALRLDKQVHDTIPTTCSCSTVCGSWPTISISFIFTSTFSLSRCFVRSRGAQ